MEKLTVLIVDDEKSIRDTLAAVISDEGWRPILAKNGKEGLTRYAKDRPDIVFLDVWMSVMDGIATLQKMKELNSEIPIIVMSGHGTIETAVKATKLGAFDFIEKPLSLDKILPLLDHAKAMKNSGVGSKGRTGNFDIIGASREIADIKQQIKVIAPKNAWVLITGENGTGKEVVARNIHVHSTRASKPFVAVNCAAIPDDLIESELFGHVRGAFTGAVSDKMGRFEMAHNGTLFLDEIGDMSLKTQAKILRILQEQSFERVGGVDTIAVDVRVVAATNKNLKELIDQGKFREDLFYRLNVIPFHIPPLRERKEDIVPLAKFFLDVNAAELSEPVKVLTKDCEEAMLAYGWPGNVRELKNLLERLCIIIASNEISAADLRNQVTITSEKTQQYNIKDTTSLKEARTDFEKAFILDKLEEFQWNISKTAEAIGIERSNLHRKLKSFDIDMKRLKG
jgi:two-component system, NtrC family, nitrogen regulation response regulator NtrX